MNHRNAVIVALAVSLLFMLTVFIWKLDQGTTDRWYGVNGQENRKHIKDIEVFIGDLHGYQPPEWEDE